MEVTQPSPEHAQMTRSDQIGMLRPGTWAILDNMDCYLENKDQFVARALEYIYPNQRLPGSPLESDEFHPFKHSQGLVVEQDKKRMHFVRTMKQRQISEMEDPKKTLIASEIANLVAD